MQGKISIDGNIITKSGTMINPQLIEDKIRLNIETPKYVCRAGFKLERALEDFKINVENFVCLDAGLSTGGFTDCLLQNKAKKVFGVDVGYGQVHEKISNDPKVVVLERTNLRYLEPATIGQEVDIVTLDLSFISILKVMPAICKILKSKGILVTLIKPQFEAEKHEIGAKGIIKNSEIHEKTVLKVTNGIQSYNFKLNAIIESPILGSCGNKEFLAYFIKID